MARKPRHLRELLKAQAEIYFSVKAQVLIEAKDKAPVNLPRTSRDYMPRFNPAKGAKRTTPPMLSNGRLERVNAPPSGGLEGEILARARRQGLEPLHGDKTVRPAGVKHFEHGSRTLDPVTGRVRANTKERFSEQPTGANDRLSEVRVGTTKKRVFVFTDKETGEVKRAVMKPKPRFKPVGLSDSVPKDGGK